MPKKILKEKFFTRPTLLVARDLLGKFLVRKIGKKEVAVMITEVEAYDGPKDLASHASRGMTDRNAIMFGAGGYFYVYLCYGMYEMLNIVTGPKNYPAAILLRGA
ncbi:MAG TPA: DNA-3-methyladenine glycosylase, partial [Candidatus Methylomirabilis sp.]|nr:DNA-3-methyladenine glycosylase [Candidatus Methylomirabilis sp.]